MAHERFPMIERIIWAASLAGSGMMCLSIGGSWLISSVGEAANVAMWGWAPMVFVWGIVCGYYSQPIAWWVVEQLVFKTAKKERDDA